VSENERLREALRNILNSGVTDIDSRIDYIEVQVDRDDWIEAGQTLYKEPETCVWNSREDYTYTRSCDGRHTALMPGSYLDGSDFQTDELCPGCGRKIEVTKWQAVKRHFEWRS